jgi:hypothetical protein
MICGASSLANVRLYAKVASLRALPVSDRSITVL